MGVSQGTVSKWINDGHSPNTDQWKRVEKFLKRSKKTRHLVGQAEETNVVPIMGRIGAGAEIEPDFEQVPPEGLEQVDLPFDVPVGIIGFRVSGDSMLPAYRNGDVVLVFREQRYDATRFIGEEAAIRTGDGRRFLKEVEIGGKPGLYNLRSHNSTPIRDVEIVWISEIYIVVKASQVRAESIPNRKTEKRAAR